MKRFLQLSYRDPGQICFTRNSETEDEFQSARTKDELTLDLLSLPVIETYGDGVLRVYVHFSGQLIKNLDKPLREIKFREIKGKHGKLSLDLSFVSVLRKRPDAIIKCDKFLTNEDHKFKVQVAEEVGCVPNYWRFLEPTDLPHDICTTSSQLKKTYDILNNISSIMSRYPESCNQGMRTVNDFLGYGHGIAPGLKLTLTYSADQFQEIQNERNFGFEALFSGTGGFVGIFLGYSLLQVPDLLDMNWNRCGMFFTILCQMVKGWVLVLPNLLKGKHG